MSAAGISDIARQRAAALQVPESDLQKAAEIVTQSGHPGADATVRLRKEWLNDLFADHKGAEYARAAANPGEHFVQWLRERLRNPFHVTYRAVERSARLYGADVALRLINITWPQEIAWAQRMRQEKNSRIAVLSAMFLRSTVNDPGKSFLVIADEFAAASLGDPSYQRSQTHDMTPDEIRFDREETSWSPLFLRYAEKAYGSTLSDMSREKMEALADRAYKDEERELDRLAAVRASDALRVSPLSRMAGIVSVALKAGLNANDLNELEDMFQQRLRGGRVELAPGSSIPYREFIDFIQSEPHRSLPPLAQEEKLRVAYVDCLGKGWIDQLPEEFRRYGAQRKELFEEWKAQVVAGERPAPSDPISDYGFFLVSQA